MDFQTIILKLQKFWAGHNCIMAQPYDIEKGAGTMNPSTFLRVLGPEPWRVAYVEPSVVRQTAVTVITRTVCSSIISSRLS